MTTTDTIESKSEPIESASNEPGTSAGIGAFAARVIDELRSSANVRSVYGDPIDVGNKTIIPVARIAYGFGGGFGATPHGDEEAGEGGGGGGVMAKPVGVVEVTEGETRFVRFSTPKRLVAAVVLGVVLGVLLGRR